MPKRRPTPKKQGGTPACHTRRRRREATELPLDKAWSLPNSVLADDVRAATERLVSRLGHGEGLEEIEKLWGVAPKSISTVQHWVLRDRQHAQQAVRHDAQRHWRDDGVT